MMARRLPAFGRELAQARRRHLVPDVGFIVVALDWSMGPVEGDGLVRVVVPPDRAPGETDFSFLAGLDVVVAHLDIDLERAVEVAGELLAAHVGELFVMNVDLDDSSPEFWRQIKGASC